MTYSTLGNPTRTQYKFVHQPSSVNMERRRILASHCSRGYTHRSRSTANSRNLEGLWYFKVWKILAALVFAMKPHNSWLHCNRRTPKLSGLIDYLCAPLIGRTIPSPFSNSSRHKLFLFHAISPNSHALSTVHPRSVRHIFATCDRPRWRRVITKVSDKTFR